MRKYPLKKKHSSNHNSADQTDNTTNQQPVETGRIPISQNLADNKKQIEDTFANCKDMAFIPWSYGPGLVQKAFSVYFTTLVQDKKMNYMKETLQDLVTHEVGPATMVTPEEVMNFFTRNGVSAQSAMVLDSMDQAVQDILSGNIVIFFDEWNKALSYFAMGLQQRQITEPITEAVVQGPHNSTIEDLSSNIGLIRNLLRSPRLKFEYLTAGEEIKRSIAFGYLDGAVNPETLTEFKRRISDIDKEEILETSYLEEWIGESTFTPFPQVRYTERPDVAVAALLDGKIVTMVNGTPTLAICPGLFVEFFAASEDYYYRWNFSILIRLLRIGALFIALFLPSTYIALSTFHSELIPTVLLLAILDTREGIPFPALVEALLMELVFEMLREAGIRLPRPVGSAVSIVGALVIGQAAIQAKIASPGMVIVVATTGIASFALPQYNMAIAIRMLRFPFMCLAASFGGLGIMIGFLLVLLHLTSLRSLDQPYFAPMTPLDIKQLRDVFISVPRKILLHSPRNRHLHKKTAERKKVQ